MKKTKLSSCSENVVGVEIEKIPKEIIDDFDHDKFNIFCTDCGRAAPVIFSDCSKEQISKIIESYKVIPFPKSLYPEKNFEEAILKLLESK